MNRLSRTFSVAVATAFLAGAAHAGYVMSASSGGQSSVTVGLGESFTLDLFLDSNDGAVHNSAIFRIEFSDGGMLYENYVWGGPYETGGLFDDSNPFIDNLPVLLDAGLVAGVGFPTDVVDIEMSNVSFAGPFSTGLLASLTFTVPLEWSGPTTVSISLVNDTIANGFEIVDVDIAGDFLVNIVIPGQGSLALLAVAALASPGASRRRRA